METIKIDKTQELPLYNEKIDKERFSESNIYDPDGKLKLNDMSHIVKSSQENKYYLPLGTSTWLSLDDGNLIDTPFGRGVDYNEKAKDWVAYKITYLDPELHFYFISGMHTTLRNAKRGPSHYDQDQLTEIKKDLDESINNFCGLALAAVKSI